MENDTIYAALVALAIALIAALGLPDLGRSARTAIAVAGIIAAVIALLIVLID